MKPVDDTARRTAGAAGPSQAQPVAGAENAASKQRGRPFKPGQSGNPSGKRPGTRHRATQLAEALMSTDLKAVVAKVVEKAKSGDMQAAQLILQRLVPVRRGRPVELDLPPVTTIDDLVAAHGAIVTAVGAGQITPEEGALVAAVLEAKRKAIETVEHERRLAEIERRLDEEKKR